MGSVENSLDLNNFPEDGAVIEDSSSTAGKVYKCRFCSLKFYKSQALGGHMNRHRQERENETLNRARQLVFHNDSLAAVQTFHHIDGQQIPHGDLYNQNQNMGDPNLYRPLHPPHQILFSGSSISVPPSPYQMFVMPSRTPPPSHRVVSYGSQYPPPPQGYFSNHFYSEESRYVPRHVFPTTSDGNRVPDMVAATNERSRPI